MGQGSQYISDMPISSYYSIFNLTVPKVLQKHKGKW
jgi:hypothetical protein